MAYQSVWYFSKLSEDVIDIFLKDFEPNINLEQAKISASIEDPNILKIDENVRKNKICWIPDHYWFSSLIYSYALKANRENFLYDIEEFESNTLQYTSYDSSDFYTWHCDSGTSNLYQPVKEKEINTIKLASNYIRKLTVSVQLSDPSEYEGGELQIMDDNSKIYSTPKERGTITVFDSRSRHRVRRVSSGVRKSLVGWVIGPRWR